MTQAQRARRKRQRIRLANKEHSVNSFSLRLPGHVRGRRRCRVRHGSASGRNGQNVRIHVHLGRTVTSGRRLPSTQGKEETP